MIELHYAVLLLLVLAVFAAGYYFGVETGRARSDTRWGYVLDHFINPMNKMVMGREAITGRAGPHPLPPKPTARELSKSEALILYIGEDEGLKTLVNHPYSAGKTVVHVTEDVGLVQSGSIDKVEVVVESLTQLNSNKKLRELYDVAMGIYPEDSINQLQDL